MGFEKFASCSLRDFSLEDELFRGSAGSVWKAHFKYDDKKYVLKQNKLNGSRSRKNAMNEIELLLQLSHPNCIRCHGHFFDDSQNSIYIVLDYCEGGDLHTLIEERKANSSYFEEPEIWNYFMQICLGVQHLHQMGIVHRDLKTLNILLTRDRTVVKVADLGVSRQMSEDTLMLQTFYGTPLYLSPEMVDGAQYTEKTDIWSLGVILFELAALRPPFKSPTLMGLAHAIKSGQIAPLPDKFSSGGRGQAGSSLERCIGWLLQQDYRQRPSINQVIKRVQHHAADSVIRPNPAAAASSPPAGMRSDPATPALVEGKGELAEAHRDDNRARRPQFKATKLSQHDTNQALHPSQVERNPKHDAQQRRTCLRNGVEVEIVALDQNRLVAVVRREKQLMNKLLQTRALSYSHISPSFVGGEVEREPKRAAHDHKLASLDAKIEASRSRLAAVEAALGANGEMAMCDVQLCGLEAIVAAGVQTAQSKQALPAERRRDDVDNVHRSNGRVDPERHMYSSQCPGVAVHQLRYDNPFASEPQSGLFQQQREIHTVFAPRQSVHAHKRDAHCPPSVDAATAAPHALHSPAAHRPSTAASMGRRAYDRGKPPKVAEARDDDFEWMSRKKDHRRGAPCSSSSSHSRGGYPPGHDRNSGSGRYNVITGAWEQY